MASKAKGVGHSTALNIAAVLRALPETHRAYQEVLREASKYGVNVSPVPPGK